jgi:hypothetical protein
MSEIYYRNAPRGEWRKRDLEPPELDTGYEKAFVKAIGEAHGIKGLDSVGPLSSVRPSGRTCRGRLTLKGLIMKKNEDITIPQMLSETVADIHKGAPIPRAMLPDEERAHMRKEITMLAGVFAHRYDRPARYLYVGVDELGTLKSCGLMDTRYKTADALGLEVVPVPRISHLRVS